MARWHDKANRIIYKLCETSYLQTNINKRTGRKYKKRRPYAVPLLAEQLVECLGTDDEERAKALFLSYDGIKAQREVTS